MSTQQSLTDQRDEAIKAARKWHSEFRRIARKAFRDHPHLLRLFGIEE